jgi:hypothetical protein
MAGEEIAEEDLLDDLEAAKMIVRLVRPELSECEVVAAAEVLEARRERDRREGVDFRSLDGAEIDRRIAANRAAIEEAIAGCRKTNGPGIGIG